MPCRGVRGATTVAANTAEAILEGAQELLEAICAANHGLVPEDLASAIFTVTPDLNAAFPARAARDLGWRHVPLMGAVELDSPEGLPRTIRILLHWNTDRPVYDVRHIYLHEAARLRPDLGEEFAPPEPAPTAEEPEPRRNSSTGRMETVAFQGEPGAYSQEAIYQHFGPQVTTLACRTFDDIFVAVEEGRATAALLPVENSQAGSINQAFDLLLDRDLRVVGEVKLRVRHSLLVTPGTAPADIVRVRSHPQALAQCDRYLRTHGWEAVPAYDTAGAARELASSPEPGTAVIAGALAGRTYGLDILDEGIEDSADNTTRFFLLGREEPAPGKNNKTSIVFATLHNPGALVSALGEISGRGINLTKIESRPRRNRPWHYVFYVDMEGHWQDVAVNRALLGLLGRTAFLKLLGSYPAAPVATSNGETR